MAVGKGSILRAANAGNKTKAALIPPGEAAQKQIAFMTQAQEEPGEQKKEKKQYVSLTEEMPSYLL